LAAAAGVLVRVTPESAAQPEAEQLWRARNFGKALFETPTTIAQAPAELKKAVELAPDSFPDRVNYGMALLRAGNAEASVAELLRAQRLDPKSPHVWFNLAIAYKRLRRMQDAIAAFERVVALVPAEPVAHYNLGYLYDQADRGADALREFELATKLDPKLVAPRFAIYNHYRLGGDDEKAARALVAFREAKQVQEAAALQQDMEWSTYAELLDPTLPPAPAPEAGSARRFESRKLTGAIDRDTAGMLALDADGDGRADLLVWSRRGILIYRNGTDAVPNSGLGDASEVTWVAAGDFDNDGLADLAVVTPKSASIYRNQKGRFVRAASSVPTGSFTRAVWLDFDHDYDLDLFLLGDRNALLRNTGAAFEDYTTHFPFLGEPATDAVAFRSLPDTRSIDLAVTYRGGKGVLYRDRLLGDFAPEPLNAMPAPPALEADFDGDGRPDRVEVSDDGTVNVLVDRTPGQVQWLGVSLAGVKNLKLAPHADIEVRAGTYYARRSYAGVPVYFDPGTRRRIDTVRVTWPNGLIQHETNVATGRVLSIKEAPRLAESCPMIYTWNGRRFEFITDVLGVAPLGASAGDGVAFPVDHDEYVRIPGASLAPVDGMYEVRIVEELREVAYIDQVRLIALDHPAATAIYTNEKFKSPPFPEWGLFGVRRSLRPVAARDERGRDLLAPVLRSDRVYATGFRHDHSGVAEMHSLTLDFGRAAPDNRAILFLEGWVDWPDGSTFRAASQRGPGMMLPYLQVKDERGAWKTVIDDMGVPAGMPKTIAVDLTGRFLSESREVRIVTNLCVYWDRIFLSEETGAPAVRSTPIDAAAADLRLRGFSRPVIDARRERPERFEYARWNATAPWDQTPGLYTRYGDVRELTTAPDDRYVVMGSGDELRLRFSAAALPPLRPGESRDFLLLVDGWAKDGDANTAFSRTVEPLPFHGMTGYPYGPGEHYPDDAAHREYRARYNTRPALRFVTRLR
jgi:Flp pilus assembly protein TadD